MRDNDMFSTLVESYHSSEQIEALSSTVESWIKNGGMTSNDDNQFAGLYQKLLNNENLNQAEILHRLSAFKTYLSVLPILEITLAFNPDEAFKEKILEKLTSFTSIKFILKISTNKDLIAGCTLSFRGKFVDYSLLRTLTQRKEVIFSSEIGINP